MRSVLFLFAGLFLAAQTQAQFTMVGTFPTWMYQVRSLSSGTRLVSKFEQTDTTRTLYNLDMTVHRVLHYAPPPVDYTYGTMLYITEDLFDNDPSTIEFVMTVNAFPSTSGIRIYREDGTLLFERIPGGLPGFLQTDHNEAAPIFHAGGITYMLVSSGMPTGPTDLFILPGQLPCMDCNGEPTGGDISTGGADALVTGGGLLLFPNPTSGDFTVQFNDQLVDVLEVRDSSGRLIDTVPVAGRTQVELRLGHHAAGLYTLTALHVGARVGQVRVMVE